MIVANGLFRWIDALDACPWDCAVGRSLAEVPMPLGRAAPVLYTPEQRRRRDASPWTIVQAVLAPAQFAVFVVSAGLVIHAIVTGRGVALASDSVVVKTLVLYTIMITGAVWEKRVFGRYLFAPAFFYEDAFSMLVLALHTLYLAALFGGLLQPHALLFLALAAYAAYAINAAQFIMKLRLARLQPRFAA